MKNKKSTVIVLLFLCTIVWGIIGWRVYHSLTDIPVNASPPSKPVMTIKKDSTYLLLNYRDPFLDDYIEEETAISPDLSEIDSNNTDDHYISEKETMPDFQYKGIIRIGKVSQAIVAYKDENSLLKTGDKIDDFVVTGITEDILTVSRAGKKYQLNIE